MRKRKMLLLAVCLTAFAFSSPLGNLLVGAEVPASSTEQAPQGITLTETTENYYVDKLESASVFGQRSDVYNVAVCTDRVAEVGDTARVTFGANEGATESYIDYVLKGQDTVVVYAYEKILESGRPEGGRLPKFSVLGENWEVDATETEIETGRYAAPQRYTRIKLTYRMEEAKTGSTLRVHLYDGENAVEVGRVELYDSGKTTQTKVVGEEYAFSVSGWITPSDVGYGECTDTVDFENDMAEMAAVGINFNLPDIWQGDTLSYRQRLVYTCNKLGIDTLVYDAELIEYLQGDSYDETVAAKMVESYKDEESFAGHFIQDEPSVSELEKLEIAAARYKKLLPGKVFYINLFPIHAIDDYDAYLETYFSSIGTERVSYDYYALTGNTKKEYGLKPTQLLNLETAATKARENGAGFYTIIASTGHYNPADRTYLRNISDVADMSFQAYTSMAYGIKGLTWFTYRAMGDGEYGEQPGMLDKYGERTRVYDYAQELNAHIQSFADVYLTYDWKGAMTFEGEVGGENENFKNLLTPRTEHPALVSLQSDEDILVGTFHNGENHGLMIVNYNDPALEAMPDVTVKFDKPYVLTVYANGSKREVTMKSDTHTFHLANGGGIFVELKEISKQPQDSASVSNGDSENNGSASQAAVGCFGSGGVGTTCALAAGFFGVVIKKRKN